MKARSRSESREALFTRLRREIGQAYPELTVTNVAGAIKARGSFAVTDDEGVIDRFLIELEFPDDYPDATPVLREIAGRIPHRPDRHVNPADGTACPIVPEEWLVRSDHGSIVAFLNGPVRNFFIGQILAEQGEQWPFGERSHGKKGLVEAYGELIGICDEQIIKRYLECLSRDIVKGHWPCPCGSNEKLRNCHAVQVRTLRDRIPVWIAKNALDRFNSM